ncbi:MAG: aspartyl-tRNA(Asn)/glutamyl-tRNA(Gln) amidotransferase subunit [Kribbellaceae bacterium]|nr:aspartyl-tRNA(Asn)/glutamyl-tRNA(Gln) amidotransferase subunit [Kribbellaceae bacterium]
MPSLQATAAAVRAGELDPVDLVEQALQRATGAARLNAVVHLDVEGARATAAAHSRAGALAGIPVLVKEIIEVEGLPYRCGSASMDGPATKDADVVRRLRAAGAVIIGLSHSHEFAYGCTGTSNRIGPCLNPHDLSRMTGGSSSGAGAAVAAGVVPLAIGTDTAGSVRTPAALCGVVGYKPANATLPTDGVFPLSQSLDTVGVLAGTVTDAVYAMDALSGQRTAAAVGTPRLGVPGNPEYRGYDAKVSAAWEQAMARLQTVEVELPDWTTTLQTGVDLQGPEAVANHMGRSTELYQPDVQQRLREAAEVPAWRYVQAQATARDLTRQLSEVLDQVDAVVLPTVPIVAPLLDAADVRANLMRHVRLANIAGVPAISIPLDTAGLPVGLQVIAQSNQLAGAVAGWIAGRLDLNPA